MKVRLALVALLLAGCPRGQVPDPPRRPRPAGGPRVDSYSESSSVTRILPVAPYAYVGTNHGLDRFDLRSGDAVHFGLADGLPGERVIDLAAADADTIWILTEAGLSRFDPRTSAFAAVPAPPSHQGTFADVAIDPVGGVWVGGSGGLFRAETDGELWGAGYGKPVTAPLSARTGDLWMGVKDGVAVRRKN